MTTITFDAPQGLTRIAVEEIEPNRMRQLAETITNNPLARHLAPILAGSIDVLEQSGVPEDDFSRLLGSIVDTCDTNPDATVSVEGFELPEYGTPAGIPPEVQLRLNQLPDVEMTLSGTFDAASSPAPAETDDVIYEDLAAMQQAGLRTAREIEITGTSPSQHAYASIRRQTEMAPERQAEQLVRAMVLGPDDVLVISMPALSEEEFLEARKRLDIGVAAGRILLVEGVEELAVLQQGANRQQETKIEVRYNPAEETQA